MGKEKCKMEIRELALKLHTNNLRDREVLKGLIAGRPNASLNTSWLAVLIPCWFGNQRNGVSG